MLRIGTFSAIVVVGAICLPVAGSAQERGYPLKQAWHQCLQYVEQVASRSPEADQERIAQFKACMDRLNVRP